MVQTNQSDSAVTHFNTQAQTQIRVRPSISLDKREILNLASADMYCDMDEYAYDMSWETQSIIILVAECPREDIHSLGYKKAVANHIMLAKAHAETVKRYMSLGTEALQTRCSKLKERVKAAEHALYKRIGFAMYEIQPEEANLCGIHFIVDRRYSVYEVAPPIIAKMVANIEHQKRKSFSFTIPERNTDALILLRTLGMKWIQTDHDVLTGDESYVMRYEHGNPYDHMKDVTAHPYRHQNRFEKHFQELGL